MEEPRPSERYVHFKGEDRIYEVVAVARNCDDPGERSVTYRQLYEGKDFPKGTVWLRRLEVFCGQKELGDGTKVKKYKKLE